MFLAAAIARNRSQQPLQAMWMDKGDIKRLLRGPESWPAWMKSPAVLGSMLRRQAAARRDAHLALASRGARRHGPGPPADRRGRRVAARHRGAPAAVRPDHRLLRLRRAHPGRRPGVGARPHPPPRDAVRPRPARPGPRPAVVALGRRPGVQRPRHLVVPRRLPAAVDRRLRRGRPASDVRQPTATHAVRLVSRHGRCRRLVLARHRPTSSTAAYWTTSRSPRRSPRSSCARRRPRSTAGSSTSSRTPAIEPGGSARRQPPGLVQTIIGGYAGIPRQEPIILDLTDLGVHNANVGPHPRRHRDELRTGALPCRDIRRARRAARRQAAERRRGGSVAHGVLGRRRRGGRVLVPDLSPSAPPRRPRRVRQDDHHPPGVPAVVGAGTVRAARAQRVGGGPGGLRQDADGHRPAAQAHRHPRPRPSRTPDPLPHRRPQLVVQAVRRGPGEAGPRPPAAGPGQVTSCTGASTQLNGLARLLVEDEDDPRARRQGLRPGGARAEGPPPARPVRGGSRRRARRAAGHRAGHDRPRLAAMADELDGDLVRITGRGRRGPATNCSPATSASPSGTSSSTRSRRSAASTSATTSR